MSLTLVQPVDHEWLYAATIAWNPSLYDAHRVDPMDLGTGPRTCLLAVLAVRERGEKTSPMNIQLQLARDGVANGAELVAKLRVIQVEPEIAGVASRLRDVAHMARVGQAAQALGKACDRGDIEAVREIAARLTASHDLSAVDTPVLAYGELLHSTIEAISAEAGQQGRMIALGMSAIDHTYKLAPGSMMVVGAQTNVGKSSIMLTWLLSIAGRGIPVGIVSVEDPAEDFGSKALGAMCSVNPSDMWAGRLKPEEWARLTERANRSSFLPLSFAYVGSRRLDDVLARIEFMVRVRGVRVVCVDYLQAIAHRPGNGIRERIDNTLAELISMCGRLGVALILASQLARPDKGSPFREPNLIDLKESGEIENRAQCVVMLWRTTDTPGAIVEAKIAKAKRQPAGQRFKLARDPDTGMLVELSTLGVVAPQEPPKKPKRQRVLGVDDDENDWGGG